MRIVTDIERRARIGRRHVLAPSHQLQTPEEVTRALTVLHSTEPATVHLAVQARAPGATVADVERALYDERTLVKQLAMRRTLWVFPRDLLPAAWGSASARVAAQLRPRLAKEVEEGGVAPDGAAWVDTACAAVLAHLEGGRELSAQELREQVPELAGRIDHAVGKSYGANVAIAPRVLTQLAVEGRLVRGRNGGHWRISRPQWTLTEDWLEAPAEPDPADQGYAELVRRWLWSFGPATEADLVWWLGATKAVVRAALIAVGAVEVRLADGSPAYLHPDDIEVAGPAEPWAALLPVLDPTVMGWKQRDWYLGDHGPHLFDRNGNAGTTAWVDGRAVGCWVQDDDGVVRVHVLEEVTKAASALLAAEAERLTRWLDGVVISTVYPSPAMKAAREASPA
jgi:hypothetical protein